MIVDRNEDRRDHQFDTAGTTTNVIAESAYLAGTMRTVSETTRFAVREEVRDENDHAAAGRCFGHGTEHFAHVVQLEGAIASNYQDAQITYVAMGADMVDDVQVKTGGIDASAPMLCTRTSSTDA